MISPISNSPSAERAAPSVAKPKPAAPQPSAQVAQPVASKPSPNDTVQVSSAAKALVQESQETSAQTAREARSGDQQAIRLLAKRAASTGLK
jgi:hypothetical protein